MAKSSDDPLKAVPGFLTKTYDIFSRDEHQEYCGWGSKGDSIVIRQTEAFSKNVLPKYFKHSNFQSFVRQLNMYDFRKTQQDPNHGEFYHPCFKFGRQDLLVNIKRKANTKEGGAQTSKPAKTSRKKEVFEEENVLPDHDILFGTSSTSMKHNIRSSKNPVAQDLNLDNDHDLNFEDSQFLDPSYGSILSSAKTAMLELTHLDTTRSAVENRFNALEMSTRRLAAENTELKLMMDEAAAKQAHMEQRMENVLRTLFNIFTKNGTIPGVSISKIIEDSSAQGGSVPLISSYGESGLNEVCTFLGIQTPTERQQRYVASSASATSTTLGGQNIIKLPSFDTGVARVTAVGLPALRLRHDDYQPNLERQSSLDWFRVKEDEGTAGQMLTRQASIINAPAVPHTESVGTKRSASNGQDNEVSSSSSHDNKKVKVEIPGSSVESHPNPAELALLDRNLNLTLTRVDTIERAIANYFGSETPKSPRDATESNTHFTNSANKVTKAKSPRK